MMSYKNKCAKIYGSDTSLRCNTRSHEICLLKLKKKIKGIAEEIMEIIQPEI